MIENGFLKLVLSDPDVSALVGNRFYALNLPTNPANTVPALPAITYRIVSTREEYTNDGPLGLVTVRMQVDSYGMSYSDTRNVANAVRTLLNSYSGTLSDGTFVLSIVRDGERSGFDENIRLPYITTDWLIQFAA